jgi:glycosyltransferase involved in cell wall biosynthesis
MAKVSVIIKAFNEEEHIAKAIESALAAIANHEGEVVVADSGSTDRTVEIAGRYPIAVAQLLDPQERCCGVGPQLGYQHCRGDYIYILDGDMELDAEFLNIALERLNNEPRTAGVGGFVREMRIANIEFESRVKRQVRRHTKHGPSVKCLNGGGLYRRSAIDDVAYFSDRNLHSYEEFDLGMRLQSKGWKVLRLDNHAADHFGYTFSTYRLLWHRARSGYIFGGGELLRAAISGKYLRKALTGLPGLRPALFIWIYWIVAIPISLASPTSWGSIAILAVAALLPVVVMAARNKNSLQIGMHSVVLWYMNALGLVIGLMRVRRSPTERIGSRLTHSGSTSARH